MPDDIRIAFFDARPYDTAAFTEVNKTFGYDIRYMTYRLTEDTAAHTSGFQVVCPFVNDDLSKPVVDRLVESGVRLLALRSADLRGRRGSCHDPERAHPTASAGGRLLRRGALLATADPRHREAPLHLGGDPAARLVERSRSRPVASRSAA